MKVTIELDVDLDFLMELLKNSSVTSKGQFLYNLKPKKEEGKPQSEISGLKLFMEVFRAISTNNGKEDDADIHKDLLFEELIATGRFNRTDANKFLNVALSNGLIYERRKDWYAKA